ncbi:hypothetical protein N9X64_00255 [bacterium]|nr:hypothetical protein [bacterium]
MPSVGTPAGVNYTTLANISGTVQSGAPAVTATTTLNHGLVVGQLITIAGSSVSGHNGDFVVADQNGSTLFIYVAGSSATATGGAATVLSRDNEFLPGLVAGDNIQFTKKGSRLQITGASGGGGSGNTLDSAYDQGGSGSGRAIAASDGAVTITVADGSNNNALEINQQDDTNNKDGIKVTTEGTGAGVRIKAGASDTAKLVIEDDSGAKTLTATVADDGVATIAATGVLSLDAGNAVVIASDNGGAIELDPDVAGTAGVITIKNGAKGLHMGGDVPPGGFSDSSFSLGNNIEVQNFGMAVGEANTCANGLGGLAVGRNHLMNAARSMCLGDAAETTGYTNAPVLAISDGTAKGGTFSKNTLVLDSASQYGAGSPGSGSGPIGGGSSAAASTIAGSAGRGNIYLETGAVFSGSADYAELFEWDDGNSNSADRRGFFVSLVNGNKIEIGNSNIVGIVSARPVILGDAAMLGWQGRYLLDEFGAQEQELRDGVYVPKVNPNYNPQQVYIPRIQRKEWTPVGLLGKIFVRSAQTLAAGAKCSSNSSGYAVSGNDYHILRVIRQPTNQKYGIIEILMK